MPDRTNNTVLRPPTAATRILTALFVLVTLRVSPVYADGFLLDKVYDPYVQPLEREIEVRSLYVNDGDDNIDGAQRHLLGLGRSFTDRLFAEVYLIGQKESSSDSFSLEAYELEVKWQLTEQGEYWADWGLLFELEKERKDDAWEYSTVLLIEKELGEWSIKLNAGAIYEWGDDVGNEWESQLASQLRYRYSRTFQPAVEVYSGEDYKGVGPVALGDIRLGNGTKLLWEAGVIFGVDSESADQVFRGMLEYEF